MSTPASDAATAVKSFPAAIVREPRGAFSIENVHIGDVRADEVLVRVVATGLCHTDVVVRNGMMPTPLPAILGHEGAGIVVSVGTDVTYVTPGDHVVMSYLSCGTCRECCAGRPSSCVNIVPLCFGGCRPDKSHAVIGPCEEVVSDRFFGQSSFAHYAIANERNVIKVDADLPLELLGPLGCGLMTGAGAIWNELKITTDMSIAVFGAGAVGLAAIMAARIAGATTIIAIDTVPSRLDLARELGATHAIDGKNSDVPTQIRTILPDGLDAAFDTSGRPDVIRGAALALGQRGTLGVVAPGADITLDVHDLIGGAKTVKGITLGGGSARTLISQMLNYYRKGQFPFDRLIQFYSLDQINDAVRDSGEGHVIKPVLRMTHT